MIKRTARIAREGLFGLPGLLVRFGTSGVLNGLAYAGVFAAATYVMGHSALVSSCAGYLAGLLVGFVLHRRFTFLSDGNVYRELLRYLVAQAVTMATVMGVARVTADGFGWPTWLVIMSGIVLAPALNLVFMYFWVFTNASDRYRA